MESSSDSGNNVDNGELAHGAESIEVEAEDANARIAQLQAAIALRQQLEQQLIDAEDAETALHKAHWDDEKMRDDCEDHIVVLQKARAMRFDVLVWEPRIWLLYGFLLVAPLALVTAILMIVVGADGKNDALLVIGIVSVSMAVAGLPLLIVWIWASIAKRHGRDVCCAIWWPWKCIGHY